MKFVERLFLNDLRLTAKITLTFFASLPILIFIILSSLTLSFPYPLDYGEGPLLNQATRIIRGNELYPADLTQAPYIISNYPPTYPLVITPLAGIFGPSLFLGRLISFISTIVAAILIAWMVEHFNPQKGYLPPLVSAAIFLSIPYVMQWGALFRVDMLALVFSLAGLFLIVRHPNRSQTVYLGTGLLLLSVFTRQSYGLTAPMAAVIYCWTRNRKNAKRILLIYLLGGVLILLLLTLLTNGSFIFHTFTANLNPFFWDRAWHFLSNMVEKLPLIVLLAILFILLGLRISKAYLLFTTYLVGGMLTSLTIGKVGSNVNYLIELSAGFALFSGFLLAHFTHFFKINPQEMPVFDFSTNQFSEVTRIDSRVRKKLWGNLLFYLLMAAVVIFQIGLLTRSSLMQPIASHRDRIKSRSEYKFLEDRVVSSADDGPVMADEVMGILAKNEIPLHIQPFELTQLAYASQWNQQPFLDEVNQQAFSLILIHHDPIQPIYLERWTPNMLESINNNYYAAFIRANTLGFLPVDKASPQQPVNRKCQDAPWELPTESTMGLYWYNGQLLMMGAGKPGEIPVFAIANGYLYQFPEWETAVAIQHEDPFNPENNIWSFYGDMAPAFDSDNNFISQEFHKAEGVEVKSGDLLGYQGQWLGPDQKTWVHLRFTLLPSEEDGSFPQSLKPIHDFFADIPSRGELERIGLDVLVSLSAYTGLPESHIFGRLAFLPFLCQVERD